MANLPIANFTSFLNQIAISDSQELGWVASISFQMRGVNNPFYELIGGAADMRPIMEVADWSKIKGQEIVFTIDRPLGGPGQQGAGTTLLGAEENQTHATFRAKIGQIRHAVATEALIVAQTVIGSKWDQRAKPQLAEWFARKMADDIMYELIARKSSRTSLFPNGKTTRDQLGRNDYLQFSTVERSSEILSANQATAFSLTKDPRKGSIVKGYMVMGNQYAFRGMKNSNTFQNLMSLARDRGNENELFSGKLPDWNGTRLYKYDLEDHTAIGPIGNPGTPRGYLGKAIAISSIASGATYDLQLGGAVQAAAIAGSGALTVPLFTQYFSNAAYIGHEGQKIAADTTTERYVAIMNLTESTVGAGDAGKIGFYAYKVNNGNKITLTKALRSANANDGTSGNFVTIGSMTWDSGALVAAGTGNFAGLATAHGVGAVVLEVNAKGVPFVGSWAIAKNMLVSGWGSIDGEGTAMHGKRISDQQDYGEKFGIGWKQVWGCRAIEDANNMPNGFVYIESAYMPDGWPSID
jgi:hypothetical protein